MYYLKSKGSPYSVAERRVPELIPVLGSQPAADVSHKTGGRLPLLSVRPAVTPATLKRWGGVGSGEGILPPSGEGSGERLCPSPENFSNLCLEIACYSTFWKQVFRLDSSLFTDQIVTLTQRQMS